MPFSVEKDNRIFEFRFGYGCLRKLGELWAIDAVQEIIEKMEKVFSNAAADGAGFSQIDMLIDIVEASIKENDNFDRDDWADFLLANPQNLIDILREFIASMPKPQPVQQQVPGKSIAMKPNKKK